MSQLQNFFFKDLVRARLGCQCVNQRWPSHRTSHRPGNASSCPEGTFPLSYKWSDTRCSQMIKSKCATTVRVSENSTSGRPLRNTGKKILVDHDVDSGLFPIRWSIRKVNETTPKKREQKKELQLSKDRACSNEDNRAASITLMAELLELRVDDRSLEDSEA